jgi:hypothetical protein
MMGSLSHIALTAEDSFRQAVQTLRGLTERSNLLLPQIEDEEARFHIWAASLNALKSDNAFFVDSPSANADATEEIRHLLHELSDYLRERM